MRKISVRIAMRMAINPGINLAHFMDSGGRDTRLFF